MVTRGQQVSPPAQQHSNSDSKRALRLGCENPLSAVTLQKIPKYTAERFQTLLWLHSLEITNLSKQLISDRTKKDDFV